MTYSNSAKQSNAEPNAHIFKHIDDYIEEPRPGHAVLINGNWGSGKSFAIKSYISQLRQRSKFVAYVSLYGVKSQDDIDTMLLTGLHSSLDNAVADYGIRISKAIFKKLSFGAEGRISDLIPKTKINLLVFDDIERSLLEQHEVLGYINQFVEHDGMHVVILANESEIKCDKYWRMREKVVGAHFMITMEAEKAFLSFLEKIPDAKCQSFMRQHSDQLLLVFQQSDTKNLRILQQTMWGWYRLFRLIEPKFQERQRGMLATRRLFTALSIELKASRVDCSDLFDRVTKIVAGRMAEEDANQKLYPLFGAQERYSSVYLHDTVLSDDLLHKMLCEGISDGELIRESLGRSEYFLTPDEEPAWQQVWHGITRDGDEFNIAFQMLEQQFKRREFTDGPTILHVMGLRLWCVKIGQLDHSDLEVVEEGKRYIDDLFSSGRLLSGYRPDDLSSRLSGAYGLSFYEHENPAFKEIAKYYFDRCGEATMATWPDVCTSLLLLMSKDADDFLSKVCWTNDDRSNSYATIPIFSACSAAKFVSQMLSLHPEDQRTVFTALDARYSHGRLKSDLSSERQWLSEIRGELLAYADALSTPPIRRFAIKNDVERTIDPLLRSSL